MIAFNVQSELPNKINKNLIGNVNILHYSAADFFNFFNLTNLNKKVSEQVN